MTIPFRTRMFIKRLLTTLLDAGYLPVVSPIARGEEGALNCNAIDTPLDGGGSEILGLIGTHGIVL